MPKYKKIYDCEDEISVMPRSQCRGSLGDQFYFHDVVENIESGINPPKKNLKESVVTSWEISYRILTRFDGKFVLSAPDQPPTISDTFADRLRMHLRGSATIPAREEEFRRNFCLFFRYQCKQCNSSTCTLVISVLLPSNAEDTETVASILWHVCVTNICVSVINYISSTVLA